MVSTRLACHSHHLEFATDVAEDVQRHLDRLGRMRALVVLKLSAGGGYRITPIDAESAKPGALTDLGLSLSDSLDVIEGLFGYEPERGAVVLVVESNPIDGVLFSFINLEWGFIQGDGDLVA